MLLLLPPGGVESADLVPTLPPQLRHFYLVAPSQHRVDTLRKCINALQAQRALVFMNFQQRLKDTQFKLEASSMEVGVLGGLVWARRGGCGTVCLGLLILPGMLVAQHGLKGCAVVCRLMRLCSLAGPAMLARMSEGLPYAATCLQVGTLHGEMSKLQRQTVLREFRGGRYRALVVSDVLARGMDVQDCDAVIHLEMPSSAAHYSHRCGAVPGACCMCGSGCLSTSYACQHVAALCAAL